MDSDAADRRIARAERVVDGVALVVGVALILVAPGTRLAISVPTLLLAAGLALLATGLVRDLAWLALRGRPTPVAPVGPREARICLESTLGVLAVAGGLAWRLWAPGPPRSIGLGVLVLGLALVATFGHLTRNVIVALRVEPDHRNIIFWS
jgi:hypothetical protein